MAISGETPARYWAPFSIFALSVPRADVPGFGPAWFPSLVPSRWLGWCGMAGRSEPRFDVPKKFIHSVYANGLVAGPCAVWKRFIWLFHTRWGATDTILSN